MSGSKGKYRRWLEPDSLLLLKGWAREGHTDLEIADKIGIASSTLYEWKNKHPEISEALKKGKEVADFEVENALFKRALGYDVTEEFKEVVRDPRTNKVTKQMVRTTTKHIAPDVTAIIFWLKNRKYSQWRDRREAVDTNDRTNEGQSTMEQLVKSIQDAKDEYKHKNGGGST